MNEQEVVKTITTLIKNNKASLVSGITHQGAVRELGVISETPLTPPKEMYYVASTVLSTRTEPLLAGGNVRNSPLRHVYSVMVRVVDYVYPQHGEAALYETFHRDFRDLVSRIVNLIASSSLGSFSLNSQEIEVLNSATDIETATNDGIVLISEILFDVKDC